MQVMYDPINTGHHIIFNFYYLFVNTHAYKFTVITFFFLPGTFF